MPVPERKAAVFEPAVSHRRACGTNGVVEGRGILKSRPSPFGDDATGSAQGRLNLEADALAQLDAATQTGEYDFYSEGQATLAARVDYVRERLRLFYVGITRAKEELVITWNTGRKDSTQALPLAALVGEGEEK